MKMACDFAGIDRAVIDVLYDRHPIFRKKFDYAMKDAGDHLEGVAYDRAVNGYYEEALTKDGDVVELKKHDNRLLQFMVKGAKKDKYSDKVLHAGHDGGALAIPMQHTINFDNLELEDLKLLENLLEKAKRGEAIEADYEELESEQQLLPARA
jgi:hypothetical protein